MKASKFAIAAAVLALSMMGAGAANATEPPVEGDPTFIMVLPVPSVDAAGCLIEPVSPYPGLMSYSVTYADNAAYVTAAVHPEDTIGVDITLTDRSGATDFIAFDPIALSPGCAGYVDPAPVVTPEPVPTTECGDVVNGFPVGDNADMCDNPPVPAVPPLVIDPAIIEEDEAGWDCATMGNMTCGPDAALEAPVVPAPVAVPQPVYDVATAERVAAGEELAYTGAGTNAALAAGVGLLGLGALAIRYSRRTV